MRVEDEFHGSDLNFGKTTKGLQSLNLTWKTHGNLVICRFRANSKWHKEKMVAKVMVFDFESALTSQFADLKQWHASIFEEWWESAVDRAGNASGIMIAFGGKVSVVFSGLPLIVLQVTDYSGQYHTEIKPTGSPLILATLEAKFRGWQGIWFQWTQGPCRQPLPH